MVEYAMLLAAIALLVVLGFRSTGVSTDRAVDHASELLRGHHDGGN